MDSMDRVLGALEAHHHDMKARLILLESKVDSLQAFRWRMAGLHIAISGFCSLIVAGAFEFFRR